jgi:hypothetical protein
VGFAGVVNGVSSVWDFFIDPTVFKKPPRPKETMFVVLTGDKKIYTFNDPTEWMQVDANHYAIGSGSTFALGALATGASALDAVKTASKFDPLTGLGYKTVEY